MSDQNSAVVALDCASEPIVLKFIDLGQNEYRDHEHAERSRKSYEVESALYVYMAAEGASSSASPWPLPKLVAAASTAEEGKFSLLLEDVRRSCGGARQPTHGLEIEDAKRALCWLAGMHGQFWGTDSAALPMVWERGSYWSLEKRLADVHKIESEWERTLEAFPGVAELQSRRTLGARLRANAHALFRRSAAVGHRAANATLIHGDFKSANIYFRLQTGEAVALDLQWSGLGLGACDVAYLLSTSLAEESLCESDALIEYYHAQLPLRVREGYPLAAFVQDFEACLADYVRFLMGSMWGSLSPQLLEKQADSLNQGMHKRSLKHLVHVVSSADKALASLESCASASTIALARLLSSAVAAAAAAADEGAGTSSAAAALVAAALDGPDTPASTGADEAALARVRSAAAEGASESLFSAWEFETTLKEPLRVETCAGADGACGSFAAVVFAGGGTPAAAVVAGATTVVVLARGLGAWQRRGEGGGVLDACASGDARDALTALGLAHIAEALL